MQGSTGETLSIFNPSDDTLLTDSVSVAGETDINKAVEAAQAAFLPWKDTSAAVRGAKMLGFAELLSENMDRIADLESRAMGQPVTVAKKMITGAVGLWRYYASLAGKVPGDSYPPDGDNTYKLVQYEPLGVCSGICAWNSSHILAAWKIAPAVAAGNTFILKSSEKSPLALAQYGELFNKAGFPPGVVNIVAGAGKTGALLASHMGIAKIAFTGSAAAGRAIQVAAAQPNFKKVTLELGGKSPALIFDDADIANAVFHCSENFLRNSGQICFGASRVLVHESIAAEFFAGIKAAFEKAAKTMGHASLTDTKLGPVADKKQFDRIMGFIKGSSAQNVQVLAGGERFGVKGAFVQPTVLLTPDPQSDAYKDEIFGPVLCVRTFKDEEEAISLANDTPYGLGCKLPPHSMILSPTTFAVVF